MARTILYHLALTILYIRIHTFILTTPIYISCLIPTFTITIRPWKLHEMPKGKRKFKAEEGKEDEKKATKKARIEWDFFHDKPE